MLHERSELEPDRLVDVQGSGQICLVEAVILGAEPLLVYGADLYQELAPGVFAVAGQQGVVQIEERQGHVATLHERWDLEPVDHTVGAGDDYVVPDGRQRSSDRRAEVGYDAGFSGSRIYPLDLTATGSLQDAPFGNRRTGDDHRSRLPVGAHLQQRLVRERSAPEQLPRRGVQAVDRPGPRGGYETRRVSRQRRARRRKEGVNPSLPVTLAGEGRSEE